MNSAMKSALLNSKSAYMSLRDALFHSTPVLERKRRNQARFSRFSKRCRRIHAKQTLLRNINAYADFLLQDSGDESMYIEKLYQVSSAFRQKLFKDYFVMGKLLYISLLGVYLQAGRMRLMRMIHLQVKAPHGLRNNILPGALEGKEMAIKNHGGSDFPEEDFDVETTFRAAFGGNRFFYYSFINEENPQWRRSGRYWNYSKSWNWSEDDEHYDSSTESNRLDSDLASDRLALGLSAFGPLKPEDVKDAYRACALKWHPDRHQGPSKVVAEEKFKLCSAAYQSLCDKLAIN